VAERGFRGTSMAAVAERAGVAAGTAYVHYDSKDELVIETYLEIKSGLSAAAVAGFDSDPDASPEQQFRRVWRNAYEYLAADPALARYLSQVEASPYWHRAHELALQRIDPLSQASHQMARYTVDLPPTVIWDLGFGPAIRVAADPDIELDEIQLDTLATACWRAVTRPD
jgi:TetR/AcrR family transcriptional repressor of multidrug resistance operon